MKSKGFILVTFFFMTFFAFGERTVVNPSIKSQSIKEIGEFKITKVQINNNNTIVDLMLTTPKNVRLYMSQPGTSTTWKIKIKENIYNILTLNGIGDKNNPTFLTANTPIYITAIFEAIPIETTDFDIITNKDDPLDSGLFNIYGIDLTKSNDEVYNKYIIEFQPYKIFEGQTNGKGIEFFLDANRNFVYLNYGNTTNAIVDAKNCMKIGAYKDGGTYGTVINAGIKSESFGIEHEDINTTSIFPTSNFSDIVNSKELKLLKPLYFIHFTSTLLREYNRTYNAYNTPLTIKTKSYFDNWFPYIIKNESKFTNSEDLRTYIRLLKNIDLDCICYGSSTIKAPVADYISLKENELIELIKKESENKIQQAKDNAAKYGIILRHTFKYGIIGTDYVPSIEKSRKKVIDSYYVNSSEVEISQYEKYSIGGYSKDVQGFTAVYQLINNTDNYYITPIVITASCKYSKTVVNNSFWSGKSYGTESELKSILKKETYILGPKEAVKDQEIVGENEPNDFTITLGNVITITKPWVDNLELALKSKFRYNKHVFK